MTYTSSFRNMDLGIQEANGRWNWQVRNTETGEIVGQGNEDDKATAMVEAALASQADWGSVRWSGPADEDW